VPRAWTIPFDASLRVEIGHTTFGLHERQMALRDVIVAFDITGIDDHVMLGLTVGVGNPRGRNWGYE